MVLFMGLFVWSYGGKLGASEVKIQNGAESRVVRSHYGSYIYSVTDLKAQNKKIVQYDPAMPADDDVVLGGLRKLAQDGFGLVVDETVQPVVEVSDETNYVTFTVAQHKILFELFRNSSGQVGSIRFWMETAR